MRKIFGIALITSLMLTPVTAQAGMGSFALGYMLGNSGTHPSSGGSTSTTSEGNSPSGTTPLYVMPNADERIKNPLGIRMFSVNTTHISQGISLQGYFEETVPDHDRYKVVAVLWAPGNGEDWPGVSFFYYFYTDWSNIRPANKLPPEKK